MGGQREESWGRGMFQIGVERRSRILGAAFTLTPGGLWPKMHREKYRHLRHKPELGRLRRDLQPR